MIERWTDKKDNMYIWKIDRQTRKILCKIERQTHKKGNTYLWLKDRQTRKAIHMYDWKINGQEIWRWYIDGRSIVRIRSWDSTYHFCGKFSALKNSTISSAPKKCVQSLEGFYLLFTGIYIRLKDRRAETDRRALTNEWGYNPWWEETH